MNDTIFILINLSNARIGNYRVRKFLIIFLSKLTSKITLIVSIILLSNQVHRYHLNKYHDQDQHQIII